MRTITGLVFLALITAACSSTPATTTTTVAEAIPRLVSSRPGIGTERLLIAVEDEQGRPLASPDLAVDFRIFPQDDPPSGFTVTGRFVWTIPDVIGVYAATAQFDRAGTWLIEADPVGLPSGVAWGFEVGEIPLSVPIGAPAPLSPTPTLADLPLEQLTSDPTPEESFYELSVDEAVRSGRPSVIIFATPKYCVSQTCGPTLDVTKAVASEYPTVAFVHVEAVDLTVDLSTVESLPYVDAVFDWGLPSEPWVFVVDPNGFVFARYEGTLSADELRGALADMGA